MQFHDFHLRGYTVLDSGDRIVMDLVYDYPDSEKRESTIEFTGVACYHFAHTTGAIITYIDEVDLGDLVSEKSRMLASFAKWHGLAHWESDSDQYAASLTEKGKRAWTIDSAIGFKGFVIASEVAGTP